MIKSYKYDNYLMESASSKQEMHFRKYTHKNSNYSNHQHEQYSTASCSDSEGENNSQYQNTLYESQTNTESHPQIQKDRYKTELCRNFQIHGTCNYGKKCQYAHGRHELNQKPDLKTNQYYKTRPCKEFFNTSACPYGQRCKYNHDKRKYAELIKQNTYFQKKLLTISNESTIQQKSQKQNSSATSSRLPIFSQNFNKREESIVEVPTSTNTFSYVQENEKLQNKHFNQSIQNSSDSSHMQQNKSSNDNNLSNSGYSSFLNSEILSSNYFQSW